MIRPRMLAALALVVAAVGIYIQIVGDVVDYPAVPPGVIVILVSLFMIIGLFAADQASRLVEVEAALDTVGLWVQMIAVVVSLVAAVVALVRPERGARADDVEVG